MNKNLFLRRCAINFFLHFSTSYCYNCLRLDFTSSAGCPLLGFIVIKILFMGKKRLRRAGQQWSEEHWNILYVLCVPRGQLFYFARANKKRKY